MLKEMYKNSSVPLVFFAFTALGMLGVLEFYIVKNQEAAAAPQYVGFSMTESIEMDKPTLVDDMKGWAWIVASSPTHSEAELIASIYADKLADVPVQVLPIISDDTTRYRVAIGTYESRSNALIARVQLNDSFPPDAWVLDLHSIR